MSNASVPVSDDRPVSGKLRETLGWATSRLLDLYGSRLKRLILFGSQARGEATSESDVDVLVVLEGPVQTYEEAKRTSRVATEAAAYRDTALSLVHLSETEFAGERRSLVEAVREDGIDLLDLFSKSLASDSSPEESDPKTTAERSNR